MIRFSWVAWIAVTLLLATGCRGAEKTQRETTKATQRDAGRSRTSGAAASLTGDYLGQTPPGAAPALFAPGVVSTGLDERDIAITPDGNEIYFGLLGGSFATIVVTRRVGGLWTPPEVAPFCNNPDVFDLEPFITPDGRQFLFLSTRPKTGQEPKPGWVYQDIWAVNRMGDDWSTPYNLGPPVDTDAPEYFPSSTRSGTLYFTREVSVDGRKRSLIHRARTVYIVETGESQYAEPEVLPAEVNPGDVQFNAFADPDDRYLIVGIADHKGNIGQYDYYVCFHSEDDSWKGPINMGSLINTPENSVVSPYVTRDGKYFFFASTRRGSARVAEPKRTYADIQRMATEPQNGNSDIYWIDASLIDALRP